MTRRLSAARGTQHAMSDKASLIGMSGSLRAGSFSNAILETLREKFADRADLEVYDLAPIPLYNQDFEGEKRPPAVKQCSPTSRRRTGWCCARPSSTTASPAC